MKLNILIANDDSQEVCQELRRMGHEAYTCSENPCIGPHKEWHILGRFEDAVNLKETRQFFGEPIPVFYTEDGERHILRYHRWDWVLKKENNQHVIEK